MTLRSALLAAALAAAAAPASADLSQFGGASFVEPENHRAPLTGARAFIAEAEAPRGGLAARRLLGGAAGPATASAAHVSPGEAQLAASLGVDPAAFTLSELARLKRLAERRSDED